MNQNLLITVLILIIVVVVIICVIAIGTYYYFEIYRKSIITPLPNPSVPTGGVCTNNGFTQLNDIPAYSRNFPYVTGEDALTEFHPLSLNNRGTQPDLVATGCAVIPLSRLRSISGSIPTNHFMSNAFFAPGNTICEVYPYFVQVNDAGLKFGWPGPVETSQDGIFPNTDVISITSMQYPINCYSRCQAVHSCDVVDFDTMSCNLIYQYANGLNVRIPLVKGVPYTTFIVKGALFSLSTTEVSNNGCPADQNPNFKWKIENISGTTETILRVNVAGLTENFDLNKGYLIFFTSVITYTEIIINGFLCGIFLSNNFEGACRVSYFYGETAAYTLLISNFKIYPTNVNLVINPTSFKKFGGVKNFTPFTQFIYQARGGSADNIILLTPPDANLDNPLGDYFSTNYFYNVSYLIKAGDLAYENNITINDFDYPSVYTSEGSSFWEAEAEKELAREKPSDVQSYLAWLGDLATMLLIGKVYNLLPSNNTTSKKILDFLENQLNSIKSSFVYDNDNWGGILSPNGWSDCTALSNNGFSFYNNHSGQLSSLVYAYAVIGHFDLDHIKSKPDDALIFIRDYMNPSINDFFFPLFRDYDFGYNLLWQTGLAPRQTNGKKFFEAGNALFGFYASYLYAQILKQIPSYVSVGQELENISITLLGLSSRNFKGTFQMDLFNFTGGLNLSKRFLPEKIYANSTNSNQTITISMKQANGYSYTGIAATNTQFPARFASIARPMFLPLNINSKNIISSNWAKNTITQTRMNSAALSSNINNDDLMVAYAIQGMNLTNQINNKILADKVKTLANAGILLSPGNTFTATYYWIILQAS